MQNTSTTRAAHDQAMARRIARRHLLLRVLEVGCPPEDDEDAEGRGEHAAEAFDHSQVGVIRVGQRGVEVCDPIAGEDIERRGIPVLPRRVVAREETTYHHQDIVNENDDHTEQLTQGDVVQLPEVDRKRHHHLDDKPRPTDHPILLCVAAAAEGFEIPIEVYGLPQALGVNTIQEDAPQ